MRYEKQGRGGGGAVKYAMFSITSSRHLFSCMSARAAAFCGTAAAAVVLRCGGCVPRLRGDRERAVFYICARRIRLGGIMIQVDNGVQAKKYFTLPTRRSGRGPLLVSESPKNCHGWCTAVRLGCSIHVGVYFNKSPRRTTMGWWSTWCTAVDLSTAGYFRTFFFSFFFYNFVFLCGKPGGGRDQAVGQQTAPPALGGMGDLRCCDGHCPVSIAVGLFSSPSPAHQTSRRLELGHIYVYEIM